MDQASLVHDIDDRGSTDDIGPDDFIVGLAEFVDGSADHGVDDHVNDARDDNVAEHHVYDTRNDHVEHGEEHDDRGTSTTGPGTGVGRDVASEQRRSDLLAMDDRSRA